MKSGIEFVVLLFTTHCMSAQDMPPLWRNGKICIEWGSSGRRGWRSHYEDTVAVQSSNEQLLFSLFDGHSGHKAAYLAADRLPGYIFNFDNEEAAFARIQKELRDAECTSGTTAVTARIIPQGNGSSRLELAGVGDSRVVLIDDKGCLLAQTSDHKPERSSEKKRVVDAGAVLYRRLYRLRNGKAKYITRAGYPSMTSQRSQSCPDLRQIAKTPVYGGLSLTRALGDSAWPEEIISPVPEILSYTLHADFEGYLIIGSDGLWDVVPNEGAANYTVKARKFFEQLNDTSISDLTDDSDACHNDGALTQEAGSSERAILLARGLRDLAYNSGSSDNITAMIVHIFPKEKTKEKSVKPMTAPVKDLCGLLRMFLTQLWAKLG